MARSFANARMKLAIADIQADALDAVREEFARSDAQVVTIKVDVADRSAVEEAAQEAEAVFDKIHVLCNNAGVTAEGSVLDLSYPDWDWVMGVNLDGVINGLQVFTNRIKAHGEGGHIVNTSSLMGLVGMRGTSPYTGSKFAVVGISEVIAQDLARFNIGVSVLCPGLVKTEIFTSERNRPEPSAGAKASSPAPPDAETLSEKEKASQEKSLAGMLDPALVGDMVLHAIQTDEFYILPNVEFKKAVAARAARLDEAFERWTAFRENLI